MPRRIDWSTQFWASLAHTGSPKQNLLIFNVIFLKKRNLRRNHFLIENIRGVYFVLKSYFPPTFSTFWKFAPKIEQCCAWKGSKNRRTLKFLLEILQYFMKNFGEKSWNEKWEKRMMIRVECLRVLFAIFPPFIIRQNISLGKHSATLRTSNKTIATSPTEIIECLNFFVPLKFNLKKVITFTIFIYFPEKKGIADTIILLCSRQSKYPEIFFFSLPLFLSIKMNLNKRIQSWMRHFRWNPITWKPDDSVFTRE